MSALWSLFLLGVGHVVGSLGLYLNHRFVLHGDLGKTSILKWARDLHVLHHKHAYGEDYKYYSKTPLNVHIALAVIIYCTSAMSLTFAVGLASAFIFYEFLHQKIHTVWRNTYVGRHHEIHHRFPRTNFGGTHPWFDTIFRTKYTPKIRK